MKKLFKFLLILVGLLLSTFFILLNKDLPLAKAKEILENEDSKYIKIDGMEVHYKREGSGFPIVLVHGTSSILQTWDSWTVELVKQNFEVIRMDLPAFGLTGSNSKNDYSIPYYVSFIDSFVTSLGIDSFHLAGNSLGGLIVWEYAIDYPNKLGKLILLDPAGIKRNADDDITIFDKITKYKFVTNNLKNIGTKYLVKKGLKDVYVDDSKITAEKIKIYQTATLRKGNRDAFIHRMDVVDQPRTDLLKDIKTPTLILWGKEDLLIDVKYAEEFRQNMPNASLIIYDEVGHVPMEEIPIQSVNDVVQFLH